MLLLRLLLLLLLCFQAKEVAIVTSCMYTMYSYYDNQLNFHAGKQEWQCCKILPVSYGDLVSTQLECMTGGGFKRACTPINQIQDFIEKLHYWGGGGVSNGES
jgi:hypothetical protein